MGKFRRGIVYEGNTTKLLSSQKKTIDAIKYSDDLQWIGDNVGIYSIPYKQEGFTITLCKAQDIPLMIPFPCKITCTSGNTIIATYQEHYYAYTGQSNGWVTITEKNGDYLYVGPGTNKVYATKDSIDDYVPVTFTPVSLMEYFQSYNDVIWNYTEMVAQNSKAFLREITNVNGGDYTRLAYNSRFSCLGTVFGGKSHILRMYVTNLSKNTLTLQPGKALSIADVDTLIKVVKGDYGRVTICAPSLCVKQSDIKYEPMNTKSIKEYFGDFSVYPKESNEIKLLINLYNSL